MGERQTYSFDELISSNVLEINDGYRAKNSELGGEGLLFLRAGHVTDTHIDFSGVDRFHVGLTAKVQSKTSQPGDVIVTTKGNSTGRISWVSDVMPTFVYSPHLSYWRSIDYDTLDPLFLRYWSYSTEFTTQLRGFAASTDMAPYLSLSDQKRLKITLLPIDEQRAIADILGSLDDKIEANRRMNATLEATARALFKSWFVDFDPVHAKANGDAPIGMDAETAALFPDHFEDSDLGPIPTGWRVEHLDKIADYLNGLALQKFPVEDEEDGLSVIKIRELRQGNTDDRSNWASSEIPPEYIVEDGDVLFSWSGSLLVDIWTGGTGALNQHLFKVTSDRYPRWFYYFWTLYHLDEFIQIAADKATTMGHIKRHHLSDSLVVVPNDEIFSILTDFIEPYLASIVNNRIQSRTLAETRDALLPKLVSGELRVGENDHLMENVT